MANHDTLDPSLTDDDEPTRRDVILIAAGGFAAIGAAAAIWPLLDQMSPDASSLSLATTDVDVSHDDPPERNVDVANGDRVGTVCHRIVPRIERRSRLASRSRFDYRLKARTGP